MGICEDSSIIFSEIPTEINIENYVSLRKELQQILLYLQNNRSMTQISNTVKNETFPFANNEQPPKGLRTEENKMEEIVIQECWPDMNNSCRVEKFNKDESSNQIPDEEKISNVTMKSSTIPKNHISDKGFKKENISNTRVEAALVIQSWWRSRRAADVELLEDKNAPSFSERTLSGTKYDLHQKEKLVKALQRIPHLIQTKTWDEVLAFGIKNRVPTRTIEKINQKLQKKIACAEGKKTNKIIRKSQQEKARKTKSFLKTQESQTHLETLGHNAVLSKCKRGVPTTTVENNAALVLQRWWHKSRQNVKKESTFSEAKHGRTLEKKKICEEEEEVATICNPAQNDREIMSLENEETLKTIQTCTSLFKANEKAKDVSQKSKNYLCLVKSFSKYLLFFLLVWFCMILLLSSTIHMFVLKKTK